MSSFHLQIVTPDGLFYDGQAESLNLRAAQGGLTILPRHTNFVTTVGMGPAKVVLEGKSRIAACIGGMLSVINGEVRLIATTFEWAEDIDRERAKSALARAEEKLADASLSKEERRRAGPSEHPAGINTSKKGPLHGSGPFFITECASTARKLFTLRAKSSHWLSDRNFFGRQSRRIK